MGQSRKQILTCTAACLLLSVMALTGCDGVGSKSASFSSVYAITSIISFVLLVGYCVAIKKKDPWFLLMFVAILMVNIGYYSISVSTSIEEALLANRLAYLGSVFLPATMLMIILDVTRLKPPRFVPAILLVIAAAVFVIAASPGYSTIYYEQVSLVVVNGTSVLEKTYGPWHCVYLFYLVGYFAAMIAVIAYAAVKKTASSNTHALILAMAALVNLGVWMLEQMVKIDFEFLSVSYIISELFLLGLTMAMNEKAGEKEQQPVRLMPQEQFAAAGEDVASEGAGTAEGGMSENVLPEGAAHSPATQHTAELPEKNPQVEAFLIGLPTLTKTEHAIYDLYLEGCGTKEIMATLGIKENTLKFHNKNLYSKLGVSSRKQLLEIARSL